MRIYRNLNGSFDVVNEDSILYHIVEGKCKKIGRVSEKWKHPRAAIEMPKEVYDHYDQIKLNQ